MIHRFYLAEQVSHIKYCYNNLKCSKKLSAISATNNSKLILQKGKRKRMDGNIVHIGYNVFQLFNAVSSHSTLITQEDSFIIVCPYENIVRQYHY